ncbi:MAG: hypothetical protein EA383_16820 [Spirochaetaceae bacterium]|nr:MAG: hypothetical protein EA383_16820 [Spirochaetaceae bacterium]
MKARNLLILLSLILSVGLQEAAGGDGNGGSTGNYTSPTIGTLVYVPAGSFQRPSGFRSVDPESDISIISEPFRMSRHPVTQSQFEEVMGANPSHFADGDDAPGRPVERVNWYAAIAFANKLSLLEGLTPVYSVDGVDDWEALAHGNIPISNDNDWNAATADWDADGYRLPTEMEWMWAAMGATEDALDDFDADGVNRSGYTKPFAGYNGSNSVGDYAWYSENSNTGNGNTTHPVGSKNANELGLYDMSGNVYEWIWDRLAAYPDGALIDYRGPASGSERILRGGSQNGPATNLSVEQRFVFEPHRNYTSISFPPQTIDVGFRLVRR